MGITIRYRLQPVLDQKERAKKEAELELAKANAALAAEKKKKEALEQEKAAILKRIDDTKKKRDQKALEGKLSVRESADYKLFLQGLDNQRKETDLKIYKQDRVIERAMEEVEKVKTLLVQRAKEFEAMSKHREQWIKEQEKEEQKKEQKLMEEIGMVQFMKRRGEEQHEH